MAEKTETKIPPEDLREIFSGPAVQANRVFLTMTGAGARLTFTEIFPDFSGPLFRAAVLLSYPDALALRDLITRQLADIERDLKNFEEEAGTAGASQSNG
jgi:hypothetical protein